MMLNHFKIHHPLLLFSYVIQQSKGVQFMPSTSRHVTEFNFFFSNTNVKLSFFKGRLSKLL